MKYELTVKLLIETPFDEDRVKRQVESFSSFGTVLESVAEALKLDMDPRFLSAAVMATPVRTSIAE
jgi:hypothetical protein